MFQLSKVSHYPKYINWLITTGERNNWKIQESKDQTDDYSVSHFYLSIYEKPHLNRKELIVPTQKKLDSLLNKQDDHQPWETVESLFLKPAVLAKWSKISKDTSHIYLEYLDHQYKKAYTKVWDRGTQSFYRDSSYVDKNEKNENKLFSSQSNSAVFAGLALLISELPDDWEKKHFYEDLFSQMAQILIKEKGENDDRSADVPNDEASFQNLDLGGSSFSIFGLAWGINNGLLDRTTYEPILFYAWNKIKSQVDKNGKVNFSNTADEYKDYASNISIGGFLAAGSEMFTYINKFYPIDKSTSYTTFMQDGGWCWYQDPRVIISNEKLIIAGLSGQSGDARIGIFDLNQLHQDSTVVLAHEVGVDDHNVPALYKRPDKSLLAVWAKHAKEKKHYLSSSKSNNYTKWTAIDTFEHKYNKGPGVTYMNLYYLEDQDKLYNFFRDGLNFNPTFITSSDYGETWENRTHFISNDVEGFQRPYAKYLQVDENTIGVSYTDAHPRKFGNNLYYVEFKDNKFYTVEGDFIQSLEDGPLPSSSAEKLYAGSNTMEKPAVNESVPNSAWTSTMAKDKNNNPHIGYTVYLNDNDLRFRISSWDGKKWNDREIAYAGKCLYKIESSYSGLLTFDPEDPTKVYISTDVNPSTGEDLGGNHEIYSAKIGPDDDISKIKWEAITSNSPHRNIRPIVVADEGYKVLLWLYGPWHTFKNYDSNVVGKILEKPE